MHTFKAKVVKGKGRGKKIGFPTINLDPVNFNMNYGVYLVKVSINGKVYNGLLHFGYKKTFNEEVSAEAYLKDFNPAPFKTFYGAVAACFKRRAVNLDVCPKNVIIRVVRKIRDVREFKNSVELKKQIEKDAKNLDN